MLFVLKELKILSRSYNCINLSQTLGLFVPVHDLIRRFVKSKSPLLPLRVTVTQSTFPILYDAIKHSYLNILDLGLL